MCSRSTAGAGTAGIILDLGTQKRTGSINRYALKGMGAVGPMAFGPFGTGAQSRMPEGRREASAESRRLSACRWGESCVIYCDFNIA